MRLDGALRDEQRGGDLGVRPALHDQVQHLGLPPRDAPVRCASSSPDRVELRCREEQRRLRAEATQLHRPDVDQVPSHRQSARHDRRRRSAHHHLTTVSGTTQTCHPIDRRPEVVAVALDRFAGVHSGSNRITAAAGHRSARTAACSRCAARSASVARVNTENVESPSPRAFSTVPPAPSTAAVTSSSWRASATVISSGARSHSSVESTTSVSTNETTPVGNAATCPA